MSSSIERLSALTIGTVESVSPSEIKVLLELDAPQATALNAGVPSGFPRINGYVLVPSEAGSIVGLVVWLGIERSPFPKRSGLQDFGLVDLPFPLRKVTLTPVGTLSQATKRTGAPTFRLQRGVSVFPSVGDPVLLPTAEQLRAIVEPPDPHDRRVPIGTAPLASGTPVTVDPNKLFGRHLAVLGNTGSGKSCSVAGLIRWSLESAKAAASDGQTLNARFIILDPNGEYSAAFSDFPEAHVFKVPPVDDNLKSLVVPAWMWNSHEWSIFAHAAPAVQRPILLQALRDMRSGAILNEPLERRLSRILRSYQTLLQGLIAQGVSGYTGFPQSGRCGTIMRNIEQDARTYLQDASGLLREHLEKLATSSANTAQSRHWASRTSEASGYNDFSETQLVEICNCINGTLSAIPNSQEPSPISEDAPLPFDVAELPDHLEQIAANSGIAQSAQFIATLAMRIRMMLADQRIGPVVRQDETISFDSWLVDYLGSDKTNKGHLAIVDLSLMPSDVLHTIVSVVARVVFEAVQRYRKLSGQELPTVLVLEEAHSFIHRGLDAESDIPTTAQLCRQTFERIAREGRKFGLGLVLSSQRPHELSATVLAQCNTFLLHRIVNDRDQDLVARLVPDNLGGLLKELPSLPSKQAILLGWAAPIPVLVEMRELPEQERPRSADPKFWEVWTGEEKRLLDWRLVADEWTGNR